MEVHSPLLRGNSIIPKLLPAFYAEYPGTYISIRDANAAVVTKLVQDGEVEFGGTTPVPFPESLSVQKVAAYRFHSVYAKRYPSKPSSKRVTWRDLVGLPVIGLHPLSSTRLQIDGELHANGIPRPWKLEVGQLATMISLVQSSAFVTVMPAIFNAQEHNLCIAPVIDPDIIREFQTVHRTDAPLSPPARLMIGLINAEFETVAT
ncbi:LysR substrate-binding domain-containing protein [Achromobacter sp. NPDC058515]|uniref:LysR substrate-binding domain-containing protein n=1 Tax=Achromobacter sp. NPDC058515 TaxID=3346533 RepID=UPI0036647B10